MSELLDMVRYLNLTDEQRAMTHIIFAEVLVANSDANFDGRHGADREGTWRNWLTSWVVVAEDPDHAGHKNWLRYRREVLDATTQHANVLEQAD